MISVLLILRRSIKQMLCYAPYTNKPWNSKGANKKKNNRHAMQNTKHKSKTPLLCPKQVSVPIPMYTKRQQSMPIIPSLVSLQDSL